MSERRLKRGSCTSSLFDNVAGGLTADGRAADAEERAAAAAGRGGRGGAPDARREK